MGSKKHVTGSAACVLCAVAISAQGQTTRTGNVDEIIVYENQRIASLDLNSNSKVGGRLGLTLMELPASVDLISEEDIFRKGDYSALGAITRGTGITSNASPGNGGTSVSARGFSGHGSVLTTYDGVRLYVGAGSVTFPVDTWTMEQVEILRGPGGVIHGVGATGATVNYVSKSPTFDGNRSEVLVSAGSFGERRLGVGANLAVNETTAFRVDALKHVSEGYVDRADEDRSVIAASARFRPTSNLDVKFSVDYAEIEDAPYWGTPLIKGEAPSAIRDNNYNVRDGLVAYRDLWPRLSMDWQLSENIRLRSTTYYMDAERQWRNMETYEYNAVTNQIDRSFPLEILHDQEQFGSQNDLLFNGQLAGMDNKFTVGFEVNRIDFAHTNNSPYLGGDSVSLTGFDPGSFPGTSLSETTLDYMTDTSVYAVFFDDVLALNEKWSIVFGGRYDSIDFERRDVARSNGQPANFFDADFSDASFRVGTVFKARDDLSLYAQFSTAPDAIGSIISLNVGADELDLTKGQQFEIGMKQQFWDGRGEYALALFDIVKKNLYTQEVAGGPVEQIGEQSAWGAEFSAGIRPADTVAVDFNLAWVDAELDDEGSLSGNTPSNIPDLSANLWLSWMPVDTLQIGGGLRYVDERFANNANTEVLPSYTVIDASAQWAMMDDVSVFLRAKNLNNEKDYVLGSYGSQQWIFAEPRSFEVGVQLIF